MLGKNQAVNGLSSSQFAAFQTTSDPGVGVLGSGDWRMFISLYGFWHPLTNILKVRNRLWFAYGLGICALSVFGLHKAYANEKTRKAALLCILISIFSILFAIGYSSPITRPITILLGYLPLGSALRETAKSLGITGLIFALWAPQLACSNCSAKLTRNLFFARISAPTAVLVSLTS